jgi:hypothetical protein
MRIHVQMQLFCADAFVLCGAACCAGFRHNAMHAVGAYACADCIYVVLCGLLYRFPARYHAAASYACTDCSCVVLCGLLCHFPTTCHDVVACACAECSCAVLCGLLCRFPAQCHAAAAYACADCSCVVLCCLLCQFSAHTHAAAAYACANATMCNGVWPSVPFSTHDAARHVACHVPHNAAARHAAHVAALYCTALHCRTVRTSMLLITCADCVR